MGGVLKTIGKVASGVAPVLGMIPGIGTIPAAIAGGAGGLLSGKGLGGAVKGAAGGALGGLGGSLLGGDTGGPLSGVFGKIGGMLKQPNVLGNAEGNLDLGKVVGLAGAGMNAVGQNAQRKSTQNYFNAQTDQRNQLMSRILSGQPANTYNFAPEQ